MATESEYDLMNQRMRKDEIRFDSKDLTQIKRCHEILPMDLIQKKFWFCFHQDILIKRKPESRICLNFKIFPKTESMFKIEDPIRQKVESMPEQEELMKRKTKSDFYRLNQIKWKIPLEFHPTELMKGRMILSFIRKDR